MNQFLLALCKGLSIFDYFNIDLTWSHLVLDFYAGLKLWEPYIHTVLSNQQKAHPDFFFKLYINLKGGKNPRIFWYSTLLSAD